MPTDFSIPPTATMFGFRVGALGFLLPASLHCEVLERVGVNAIPNVAPWFGGLANSRGNIVPVVDLHILLDETPRQTAKRYLFAVDRGEKTVAFWIDGYPQMLSDFGQLLPTLPVLPECLGDCLGKAYKHDGQLWLELDIKSLLKTLGRQPAVKGADI